MLKLLVKELNDVVKSTFHLGILFTASLLYFAAVSKNLDSDIKAVLHLVHIVHEEWVG